MSPAERSEIVIPPALENRRTESTDVMTKEQERNELHRTIWRIANDLRGSVDGWDFKAYVLGMLFYRFISENLTIYLNKAEAIAGNTNFDYARSKMMKLSSAERPRS